MNIKKHSPYLSLFIIVFYWIYQLLTIKTDPVLPNGTAREKYPVIWLAMGGGLLKWSNRIISKVTGHNKSICKSRAGYLLCCNYQPADRFFTTNTNKNYLRIDHWLNWNSVTFYRNNCVKQ